VRAHGGRAYAEPRAGGARVSKSCFRRSIRNSSKSRDDASGRSLSPTSSRGAAEDSSTRCRRHREEFGNGDSSEIRSRSSSGSSHYRDDPTTELRERSASFTSLRTARHRPRTDGARGFLGRAPR
jgi:hypothetical protein